jgi:hypothetical protein
MTAYQLAGKTMFGKLFEDVVGVVTDAAKVVVAPVAAAASVAREITKPVADVATEVAETIQDAHDDKRG